MFGRFFLADVSQEMLISAMKKRNKRLLGGEKSRKIAEEIFKKMRLKLDKVEGKVWCDNSLSYP